MLKPQISDTKRFRPDLWHDSAGQSCILPSPPKNHPGKLDTLPIIQVRRHGIAQLCLPQFWQFFAIQKKNPAPIGHRIFKREWTLLLLAENSRFTQKNVPASDLRSKFVMCQQHAGTTARSADNAADQGCNESERRGKQRGIERKMKLLAH
ncbi:hypothetical protein [Rhizobium gallicum]|uniref:hypothetical protein n=1 Tax=Rhizobium gallicum TaxID=56730 RepID=UPI00142DF008|nr:hypothetical protein [Rhizobium gallicum]